MRHGYQCILGKWYNYIYEHYESVLSMSLFSTRSSDSGFSLTFSTVSCFTSSDSSSLSLRSVNIFLALQDFCLYFDPRLRGVSLTAEVQLLLYRSLIAFPLCFSLISFIACPFSIFDPSRLYFVLLATEISYLFLKGSIFYSFVRALFLLLIYISHLY